MEKTITVLPMKKTANTKQRNPKKNNIKTAGQNKIIPATTDDKIIFLFGAMVACFQNLHTRL